MKMIRLWIIDCKNTDCYTLSMWHFIYRELAGEKLGKRSTGKWNGMRCLNGWYYSIKYPYNQPGKLLLQLLLYYIIGYCNLMTIGKIYFHKLWSCRNQSMLLS